MGPDDLTLDQAVLLRLTFDWAGQFEVPLQPPHAWVTATPDEAARILVPGAYKRCVGRDPQAKADAEGCFVAGESAQAFTLVLRGEYLRWEGRTWQVSDPGAQRAWRQVYERARTAAAP